MDRTYFNQFASQITKEVKSENTTDEKFVDWETVATVLVFQGIPILLPELKEWVKLGMTAIALKRQELEKKLMEFAVQKELNYAPAKQTAAKVVCNITEKNVKNIISTIEGSTIDEA